MDSSEGEAPPAAVALVADMIFASRIRGAAETAGTKAVTVTSAERLVESATRLKPRLILIDLETRRLDAPALVARLKGDPATAAIPIVAFGSHVNADALRAARDAGADRVLARSGFVRDLPELLRG